jgi:hypothetical protein
LMQWVLAILLVIGGLAIWRLSSVHQASAQESPPDSSPCEGQ